MPPPVPQQYLKPYPRTADQNFPVPLSNDDIMSDLSVMGYFKQYDAAHKPGAPLDNPAGMRKVLAAVATPYQNSQYVAFTSAPREDPEQVRDSLGLPAISSLRDQPSPGNGTAATSVAALSSAAVPMSRQSSAGGVAMSRQGSSSTRGKGRKN